MSLFLALLLSLLGLAPLASAQGTDPATPLDGFGVIEVLDIPVSLSDGCSTFMDIRYPDVAAGPAGWPTVVVIHGLGGSRKGMAGESVLWSSVGYLSIAYDVRGQGDAGPATPTSCGSTFMGLRERIDLGEVIEAALAATPGLSDPMRIAVIGQSQGGAHSWMAGAFGGQTYPPNPWNSGSFPPVAAVIPQSAGPDFPNIFVPQGKATIPQVVKAVSSVPSNVVYDAQYTAALFQLLLAEDYAGLWAFHNAPERNPLPGILTTDTPLHMQLAWDDSWFPANTAVEAWNAMVPATPRQAYLGTGGHGTPTNATETEWRWLLRKNWLDVHLKGASSMGGGLALCAITPEDEQEFLDPESVWDHRNVEIWPPSRGEVWRLYFRESGHLSEQAATGPEAPEILTHAVAPGITISDYIQQVPPLFDVLSWMPLSRFDYLSQPLLEDKEMLGVVQVHLEVSSPDLRYQLHGALYDIAPDGSQRIVCRGFGLVRDDLPPGSNAIDFPLSAQGYVWREGHRVAVRLQNLAVYGNSLFMVPYFDDATVAIRHEMGAESWIDLPLIPWERPSLVAGLLEPSLSHPEDVDLALFGTSALESELYLVLGSVSGTSPGLPLGMDTLPLNPDFLTDLMILYANSGSFQNTLGTLSPKGGAKATFVLPTGLDPALAGLEIHFAALVRDGGPLIASNAVTVTLVP